MAKIVAIGTDGTRPVVWGMGATEAEALEDARHWLVANQVPPPRGVETCTADDLRTVEVDDERAARIAAGDVDASDLWT
ncbi:MAG TPA: hypothetical protein VLT47_10945 [Anaeromyxobacteraceae bacterium]|nr:hypothetical protein [Anaeromyxobacteraceae bacterium]